MSDLVGNPEDRFSSWHSLVNVALIFRLIHDQAREDFLNDSRRSYVMKPRQPFDDISNTNSGSVDTTASCLEGQTVRGLGLCESSSSGTQSSSSDGISTRLNESYNCEKVSKRTDLVPTTIYEAVICRGGNQATIDDVDPFTVLSDDNGMELEHDTSTGVYVEESKKLEVRVNHKNMKVSKNQNCVASKTCK